MNDSTAAPQVQSTRLMMTLAVAGALAGLLIVSVYEATEPRITAYKAAVLQAAVTEVLQEPESFDTLFVVENSLVSGDQLEGDPADFDHVYRGYRDGAVVGYAIVTSQAGFQDQIRIIFGLDQDAGALMGMRVLENKETPGLGDKIVKDLEWVAQFDDASVPLNPVKPGESAAPADVDMITGATISSRTVIRAINSALEAYTPLIEAFEMRP